MIKLARLSVSVSGETVFRLAKWRNRNLKKAKLFRNWRNLAKFAQTSEIGETGRNFRNLENFKIKILLKAGILDVIFIYWTGKLTRKCNY